MSQSRRFRPGLFNASPAILAILAVVAGSMLAVPPRSAVAETPLSLSDLKSISDAYAEVVERVSPAVVFIEVTRTEAVQPRGQLPDFFSDPLFERFFGPPPQQRDESPRERMRRGSGSGFFISEDGLIITNHHVAGTADSVTVRMVDGREYEAEVIGSDEPSDIAIIKVEGSGFPHLELGDSDALRVGEWVLAIGAPFGLASTVTQGIVSAKSRGVGILEYEDFIQTDAAINLGNSGGPLIDLSGRVVGVNTAIFSRDGGSVGIGLAIPINSVKMVRDALVATGTVTRGFVGVQMRDLTPDLAEAFGVDRNTGILVVEVLPNSPAEKAGLQRGDIIVEYDGASVESSTGFRTRVAFTKPGETREIVVLRDGRRVQTDLTLVPREEFLAAEAEAEAVVKPLESLGITVQNLTEELAEQLDYSGHQGVLVTEVAPGSVAQRQGIRRGTLIQEVNHKPVSNVAELEAAISERDPDRERLLLFVRFQDSSNYVTLPLPE